MADWTLLRPWWLLALGLPLLLLYWHWRQHHTGQDFIRQSILRYLRGQAQKDDKRPNALWWLLPWALGVLALAGPAHRQSEALYQSDEIWIWMLDTSRSMLADDVPPSRLLNARYQLFNLLEQSPGRRIALIAFAGDAYVIAPPTDDHQTLQFLLTELEPEVMPVAGSNPQAAIEQALTMAKHHPARLLLVTDDLNAKQGQAIATRLQRHQMSLDILAVGSEAGAPLRMSDGSLFKDRAGQLVVARSNFAELAKLAQGSGGRLLRSDRNPLDLQPLLQTQHPTGSASDQQQWRLQDLGYWLLLPLLPLALLFRRGWFFSLCLAASLLQPSPGWAADAMRLYQQGEFAAAAQTFSDPLWQGNAWFHAGRYAEAAAAYRQVEDSAEALYNLGNALAYQQDFPAALEAYGEALQLDPELLDARYNRALVEQWLHQQQSRQAKSRRTPAPASKRAATPGDLLDKVAEEPGNLMRNRLRLQQQRRLTLEPTQTW